MTTINKEVHFTLKEWKRRATRATWCHQQTAIRLRGYHFWIGVPLVILSATVGALSGLEFQYAKEFITVFSVVAAILAGLQTFLNFSELAGDHRKASSNYSAIRRDIEQLLAAPPASSQELNIQLTALRTLMDKAAENSPSVPPKIWSTAEEKYSRETYLPKENWSEKREE